MKPDLRPSLPSRLVGLMVEPGPELLVGMLGILKSGRGFVPLDPDYPAERLELMVRSCGLRTLVTGRRHRAKAEELARRAPGIEHLVCVDGNGAGNAGGEDAAGSSRAAPASSRAVIAARPAGNGRPPDPNLYVIFTSGSTGTPKGVPISHRNLMPLLRWSRDRFGFGEHTRVLQSLSYGFDFGIFEILTTLLFGGTFHVTGRAERGDVARFLERMRREAINTLHTTPSFFQALAAAAGDGELDGLEVLHLGGEALSDALVARARALTAGRCAIFNGYGPTETSVNCALFEVDGAGGDQGSIPIGLASANNVLFVLDAAARPVPIGAVGELCIGGDGVSAGYLGSPRRTAEKFIPDPLAAGPPEPAGGRLYRSGDLVRYRADGNLEFLGRIDHQVKVRGFRVEPDEIAAVLSESPAVDAAVVMPWQGPSANGAGDLRLVAYVVPAHGVEFDAEAAREELARRLPAHMVPAAFVPLESLPLTAHGKVDRRALSGLELPAPSWDGGTPVAPRTPVEEVVAGVCRELLGLERISVEDDLFALGCHSLLAARIVTRLRELLEVDLPLTALFEAPTVAGVAERIEGLGSALELPPLRPVPRTGEIPLSFSQERLWFLHQLDPASASYHVPRVVRMRGRLSVAVMEGAYSEIVRRHEILRTTFPGVEGRPVQVIHPPRPVRVPIVDLQNLRGRDRDATVRERLLGEGRRRFDLARGPLLRLCLLRLGTEDHVLIQIEHHLVHDGWTQTVLAREFLALYTAFFEGRPSPLPELPVQYADFVCWQRRWLRDEVLEGQLEYWRRQLAGAPPLLELPADRPRPAVQSFRGGQVDFDLPAALADAARGLSHRLGGTLFMTFLAVFDTLLYRYSGQTDLSVGTGIANRRVREVESLIGMVINTVVLRTRWGEDPDSSDADSSDADCSDADPPTFAELFQRVRRTCLEAYAHQDFPFEKLVDALRIRRTLSSTPLFQVMLAFMDAPMPELDLPALELSPIDAHNRSSKFDVNVTVIPQAEQRVGAGLSARGEVTVLWEFSDDLFDEVTMRRMARHFRELLRQVSADPERRLDDLPLLSDGERHQVLREWHGGGLRSGGSPALDARFETWAARRPEAVALVCGEVRLTYGELARRAGRLARALARREVGPGSCVGLFVDRSPELVIAVLATLRAGAAYVPLDPEYPAERVAFVLADTRAPILLTCRRLAGRVPTSAAETLCVEDVAGGGSGTLPPPAASTHAAYVLYTSGSTGKPKGVVVEHRHVGRLLDATEPWFGFSADDVWTLFHSYAFDFSVWELWGALAYGGRLVVVPYWVSREPESFHRLLARERVTVLNQTPSAFYPLIELDGGRRPPAPLPLSWVIFGGEALDLPSLAPWFEHRGERRPRLVNMYGITETTVHVTYRPLRASDARAAVGSRVGRAIPDLALRVLDARFRPAPAGVPGELCVGGAGVSRGYLNRPRRTAERFVPDPWGEGAGARLYRSGDLGRFRHGGDLEYLGRIDHQVKVRGFRIELGEIESALARHPRVRQAVVVARGEDASVTADRRLVAYLVPADPGDPPAADALREDLARRLPSYMLPALFVTLDALPRTPTGKLDRSALPAPDAAGPGRPRSFAAPRSPAERALAEIWAEVLGVDRVGLDDNFFALGGDSIRSIQVRSKALARGLGFSVQELFQHQTLGELARHAEVGELDEALPATPPFSLVPETDRDRLPEDLEDAYPLSRLQAGMFFHSEYHPGSVDYHNVTTLHLAAPFDEDRLREALDRLAGRHPVLRTSFRFRGLSEPLQLVHGEARIPQAVEDLRSLPAAEQEERIAAWFAAESGRRFDPEKAPLIRFAVHRRSDETFQLGFTEHHAIVDGWSMAVLLSELFELYFAPPGAEISEPPAVSFRDFVAAEQRAEADEASREFWRRRLADLRVTTLPRWREEAPAPRAFGVRTLAPAESVSRRLEEIARELGVPLKSVLLAAHVRVLGLLGGASEVVTGVVTNGRPEAAGAERTLGLFLNTLPFRLRPPAGSWLDLVRRCFEAEQELLPHRRYPMAAIQQLSAVPQLFEAAFNFVHFHVYGTLEAFPQVEVLDRRFLTPTNFPLLANFVREPASGRLELRLEHDASRVGAAGIAAVAARYAAALEALAEDPAASSRGELLSAAERHQLLVEWNDTAGTGVPAAMGIHDLVEAQAGRTPDAVALVGDGERLSYRQLAAAARSTASRLAASGVGPETVVGICMERSPEMVVALLAILEAGGAYLPLDPAYPRERLAFMLEDAGAALLVTQESLLGALPESDVRRVLVEVGRADGTASPSAGRTPAGRTPAGRTPDGRLAYLIYTSGSTGRPKGVAIEHRSTVTLACWARQAFSPAELSGVLAVTSICFDLSVFELFVPLAWGGTVILADSALEVPAIAARDEVTLVNTVPSAIAELVRTGGLPAGVQTVNLAGEPLRRPLVDEVYRCRRVRRVLNLYGPSEDTTYSTVARIAAGERREPSIGRPVSGTRAVVLDAALGPVPVATVGELCLGGRGLARGYLGRPALTAAAFVPDPFGGRPGRRLYRTGDLARRWPDGRIDFLGRADHQVKLRGFRIELGEIEAALRAHPAVAGAAAIVVRETRDASDPRLVACVVPAAGAAASGAELRAGLEERLPAHLVPALVLVFEKLPVTPNGKLDRQTLERQVVSAPEWGRGPGGSFVSPRGDAERTIAGIWRRLLAVDRVGARDNFFDLGGHSLLLLQVREQLREAFGREIPVAELFRHPTVAALAKFLAPGDAAPRRRGRRAAVRLGAATGRATPEIAIVAMTGRFPGSRRIEEFWRNLCDGVESISFFSDDELLAAGADPAWLRDPRYVKAGAVLEEAELFDAELFGIPPREAEAMDPQQRIFLECAWEVLELAGYDPEVYRGSIGVYAGVGMNRYLLNLYSHPEVVSALGGTQLMVANDKDFLPTRVSYKLNLRGPSVNVQAACSTSLVAVHLAGQALLQGECDMALAGGVSVAANPRAGYFYQEGGIASADGHCRAFDAGARGTVFGSGVGIVLLKRLPEALADGDTVHAVIKGSAINNDGSAKVGFTAPSVEGQAEVIAEALEVAGVEPESIGYVEAHGTGTPLGDPIEVAALEQVFAGRPGRTCALGSVKTNVGHLDTAAGAAGLIKTVLALQHRRIPPSLHFREPNPEIDFGRGPFYVPTALGEWPARGNGTPCRAGVSSFGIGGTNAHVVVEEAPAREPSGPGRPLQLLVLSARTAEALEKAAANLGAHLRDRPPPELADVAYTLAVGRRPLEHRRALLCRDARDAVTALEEGVRLAAPGELPAGGERPVVFLFPGQGSQYAGMGRELYETEEVFRRQVDRCGELLEPHLGLDLQGLLYPAESGRGTAAEKLAQTAFAQPALFTVEYALARQWMAWGVAPRAMIGHSIGEYVAATLAGVLELPDALALVAARGALMQGLPPGAMLSVALPAEEVGPLLGEGMALAAVNAPELCVVSGPAVETLARELGDRGVECRLLRTSHAFHSEMMEPILAPFRERVAKVALEPPRIPYVSNLTGTWIRDSEATDPGYWSRHLRSTVRFSQGLEELLGDRGSVLLEVGPGRTLSALALQHAGGDARRVFWSLGWPRDRRAPAEQPSAALGQLWSVGAAVDWEGFYAGQRRHRIVLPTYPFERRRYWLEARREPSAPALPGAPPARRREAGEWFYEPGWKLSGAPAPFDPADGSAEAEGWLLFLDDGGLGDEIRRRLEAAGRRVFTVRPGKAFDRLDARSWTVRPAERGDYEALVEALGGAPGMPRRIVHLWNVSGTAPPRDADAAGAALDPGFYSLLGLAQALGHHRVTEPVRLGVVADAILSVDSRDALWSEKAAVLGPCRVIPEEYPNVRCSAIDVALGAEAVGRLTSQLLAEVAGELPDPVLAYRGRSRRVWDLVPVTLDRTLVDQLPLRHRGVYLITGGLGGLGRVFARALAERFQARLVLVGRSPVPPDEDRRRELEALEEHGAELLLLSADVTDPEAVEQVLRRTRERFGELHGVIHAAGERGGEVIQRKDPAAAARVLAPKVRGTRVLGEALANSAPEVLVLCSSLASVVGTFGQVDYAAANSVLDAFAHEFRQRWPETLTLAIDWGAWAGVGMGEGGAGLSPAAGVEALLRVLSQHPGPQVVVSHRDLSGPPAAEEPPRPRERSGEAPPSVPTAHRRPRLASAYVAPRDPLENQLAELWQELLGLEQVGIDDDFFELGGHSLLATRMFARLQDRFDLTLPLATLAEAQTVAELARVIARLRASERASLPSLPPLVAAGRDRPLPLSHAQERLWFLDQLAPGDPAYHIVSVLRLRGPLRRMLLERSYREILRRHEALRTRFVAGADGAEPAQVIVPPQPAPLPVVDLGGLPAPRRHTEARRLLRAAAARPFDLARDPLCRLLLVRQEAGDHLLALSLHHIVADGWSMGVLIREVAQIYTASSLGQPSPLPELPVQYADYAVWQRGWLRGETLERLLEYWRRRLAGSPALVTLPPDRPRPAVWSPRGALRRFALAGDTAGDLRSLSRRHGVSLFMSLLAAFVALVYRYTGRRDVVLGTDVANRTHAETEGMIGFFVNQLVLRVDAGGEATGAELLDRVRRVTLDAYAHQELPFEKLVQALQPERSLGQAPLYQMVFGLQPADSSRLELPDLEVEALPAETVATRFDLEVGMVESADGLWGFFQYSTELFDTTTILRLQRHFQALLEDLAAEPDRPVSALRLLRPAELQHLLVEWNPIAAGPSRAGLYHRRFEAQVAETPDAVAAACDGRWLSYRQLDRIAERAAGRLVRAGVGPEEVVALVAGRDLGFLAALLAIFKAGGAYLPLDPGQPPSRLAQVLDQSPAHRAVVAREHRPAIEEVRGGSGGLRIAELEDLLAAEPESDAGPPAGRPAGDPARLAYVLFTSGSTGVPKGALLEHRGMLNHLDAKISELGLTAADAVAQTASQIFDISVWQFLAALLVGGRVQIFRDPAAQDPAELLPRVAAERITILETVPSLLHLQLEELERDPEMRLDRSGLRWLIPTGEALPPELCRRWLREQPGIPLLNAYGPTECSDDVAHHRLDRPPAAPRVAIGRPVLNTRLHVLDRRLRPLPIGAPGELLVGGAGVGRGYLRDPRRTAEVFLPDPLADGGRPGARLYRTGDLVRFLADGLLDFIGRIDHQVKVRGFRIELGEIETVLGRSPGVRRGVVTLRGSAERARLAAYVVPEDGAAPAAKELRRRLLEHLPEPMVPATFTFLDRLPLTPQGKVDRKALPAPEPSELEPARRRVAPRTPSEERLAAIWSEILEVEGLGVEDNFFDLGGHSLLATRMVAQVRRAFDVDLPLRSLFETPSIAALAAEIERRKSSGEVVETALPTAVHDPADRYRPFPLNDIQQAYWLGRNAGFEMGNVATHIYTEAESDDLDLERLTRALRRMIERHDMLRMVVRADGRQQILERVPPYTLKVLDLEGLDDDRAREGLAACRREMSHQVLPTDRWPLFEVRATRLPGGRIRLHVSLDLLVCDAWSSQILFRELSQLYLEPERALPALEFTFRDYVLAEKSLEEHELYRRSRDYWLARLAELPPAPELALAKAPAEIDKPRFIRQRGVVDAPTWERLKKRATELGVTPSALTLAVFAEVLTTWAKSPRFTVNLTLFRRLPFHPQVNQILGDFTSLILMAIDNSGPESFEVRARRVQQQLWDDLDHSYFSAVRVLRELARSDAGPARAAMPVVFTSVLTLDESLASFLPRETLDLEPVFGIGQTPQVWLDFQVEELPGGDLLLFWDAVEELFPEGMLDDMFAACRRLFTELAGDGEAWRASRVPLVPAAQLARRAEINRWPGSPAKGLLHQALAVQAAERPRQPAVVSGTRTLDYRELQERAVAVCRRLSRGEPARRPAEGSELVAVVMEKGWEQTVAVLGILGSGAAYLPIDPALPGERIAYLLDNGGVRMALTQSWVEATLEWPAGVERLAVDTLEPHAGGELPADGSPADLAYVIYTSGSSGRPKGVMLDHQGPFNTVHDVNRRFAVGPEDRLLALSNLSFDLSVYDVFGALAAGAATVVPDAWGHRDPSHWLEILERFGVTVWNSVPALMQLLVEYLEGGGGRLPPSLRLVLLSGDWIPVPLAERLRALSDRPGGVEVIGLGGATEASVWSIFHPIGEVDPDWKSVPYGRPLSHQTFHVLDSRLEPRPVWVPGELYIGGAGLARGYWRDEEKTAAAFVRHPDTGETLYRTGDLGRYLPDGQIEFLGREDFQVKIQGHRIELGEIEATLELHPRVRQAVVSAFGEAPGPRTLVAHVVPAETPGTGAPAERAGERAAPSLPEKSGRAVEASAVEDGAVAGAGADAAPAAGREDLELLELKLRQPGRRREPDRPSLQLDRPALDRAAIERLYRARQSHREFDRRPVPLAAVSELLACLRQLDLGGPFPKRRYGSAGSLYPVQAYLAAHPGRVRDLAEGVYYYDPAEHRLVLLSEGAPLEASHHAADNRAMFEQSAFSIFLIADLGAIEPVYGEHGHRFATLEGGLMTQLLETTAGECGLGLCQVGSLDFDPLRRFFALGDRHALIHSLVGGGVDSTRLAAAVREAGVAPPTDRFDGAAELKSFLEGKLPAYMVPAVILTLPELPLTANGKVDRRALPSPDGAQLSPREFVAPRSELELQLAEIVRELVGGSSVGIHDSFFELGAHSVHLVQFHARLRDLIHRDVPLVALFDHPTIASLTRYLHPDEEGDAAADAGPEGSRDAGGEEPPEDSGHERLLRLRRLRTGSPDEKE